MGCPESSRSSPTRRRRPRAPPVVRSRPAAAATPLHRPRLRTPTNCNSTELQALAPPPSLSAPPSSTSITPSPAARPRILQNAESGHCMGDCACIAAIAYRTLGPYRSGRLQFSPVGSVPYIDGNLSSRAVHRCARPLHPSPFRSAHGCMIRSFHGTGADLTESPRPTEILTAHA